MPDSLTHIDFWIVVSLMMGIIWYQQRSAREFGFKEGISLGLMYGVEKATEVLTKGDKYSVTTDTGNQVYFNEALLEEILESARDNLIKNLNKLT